MTEQKKAEDIKDDLLLEWVKEAQREDEEPFVPSDSALELLCEYLEFLHEVDENINRDNTRTYNNRKSNLKAWVRWCEEERDVDVAKASRVDLVRHIDYIYDRLSDSSIGARVSSISVFYLWATNRNYVDASPTEGFSLADSYEKEISPDVPMQVLVLRSRDELEDDEQVVAVSPDVIERIIEHPGSPALRNRLCMKLLWFTGVRCVELAGVEIGTDPDWKSNDLGDLDRKKRRIRITTAKTTPKDDNHRRWVYYPEELDYDLYAWIEGGEREASQYSRDSPYLLLTSHNDRMRPTHISRIVKESAYRAGVNESLWTDAAGKERHLITGHTIRHSMATFVANRTDTPIQILANWLGHRKLDTSRRYISDEPEAEKQHAESVFQQLRRRKRRARLE